MTITREQLELAARAAGIEFSPKYSSDIALTRLSGTKWYPQNNHGQLLDLAMACDIAIDPIAGVILFVKDGYVRSRSVDCQDFPALAHAVITAAAEQQLAKEKKE